MGVVYGMDNTRKVLRIISDGCDKTIHLGEAKEARTWNLYN